MRYFANVGRHLARIGPDDGIGPTSFTDDPAMSGPTIGIAYPTGHLGGWRWDWSHPESEPEHLGRRVVVWRLVVGKAEVDGRFALRMGEFDKLGEDAM